MVNQCDNTYGAKTRSSLDCQYLRNESGTHIRTCDPLTRASIPWSQRMKEIVQLRLPSGLSGRGSLSTSGVDCGRGRKRTRVLERFVRGIPTHVILRVSLASSHEHLRRATDALWTRLTRLRHSMSHSTCRKVCTTRLTEM